MNLVEQFTFTVRGLAHGVSGKGNACRPSVRLARAFALTLCLGLAQTSPAAAASPWLSIEGEIDVLHIDEFDKGKSRLVYWIKDEVTGKRTELAFDREPPGDLRSGMKVTLRGQKAEHKFKVGEIVAGLQESGSTTSEEPMVAEAGTGIHHALVMIVNMPDSPGEAVYPAADDPSTPGDESAPLYYNSSHISQVEQQMFYNSYSVDSMYREASFDQLSFPATMGNNVVLVETPYFAGCPYYSIASAADAAATAQGVNLGAYHNRVYLVPKSSISDCTWLALGQLGSYGGSAVKLSWSTRNDTVAYAHEIGHNLGWHHAGTDANLDGVWDSEYGDTSGIMGYCCYKRKVNSVHAEQIGWYDSPELADTVVRVFGGGTYQVAPLGSDPTVNLHPQILKIDKADTGEMYYISYRQRIGQDSAMPSKYTTGASIHHAQENGNRSFEIKVLSASNNHYVDQANGLTVTQLANDAGSVTLSIDFGGCVENAPSVAVGPASAMVGASGESATYTVTVSNNDSQGCGDHTFNLALGSLADASGGDAMAGFSQALGVSSLSLAPGQSGSTELALTPLAVADDLFTLTVIAQGAGGSHLGSGQAELVLDTTSPESPTGLSATSKKVKGQQSVYLTWDPAIDQAPGSGVAGYRVYRAGVLLDEVAGTSFAETVNEASDYAVYSVDLAGHVSLDPATVTFTGGGGGGKTSRGGGKIKNSR